MREPEVLHKNWGLNSQHHVCQAGATLPALRSPLKRTEVAQQRKQMVEDKNYYQPV